MKFYYAPMSCAFATHVVLEDAEAKYEAIKIDLKKGDQQRPEFLQINPKGRVPALVTEKGILTENDIPCYIKGDFFSTAYNINALSMPGGSVKLYIPKAFKTKAEELIKDIIPSNE